METLVETSLKSNIEIVSTLRYIYLLGSMHSFCFEICLQYGGFKNNNPYQ